MRVIGRMIPMMGCALLAACSSGDDKAAGNGAARVDTQKSDASADASKKPPPAQPEGKAMSMEDMAKSAQAMGLKPGTWKVRVEIADIRMKGLPGGSGQEQAMADAMKKRMASHEITSCMTPEQAAKPSADMLAARQQANCTYANSSIAGGKIHAEMTCKPKTGSAGTMTAVMDGTYAPDRYTVTMDMKTAGENNTGMTMKSSTIGQWVGPNCKPKG